MLYGLEIINNGGGLFVAYSIILVDDEDEVRGRIASKIEGRDDFKIIGSASNGYDALDLLEEEIPDVLVTDIKMPFVDGIELTRQIRDRYPTVQVVIISGYDDYSYLKEAINLDVAAYLSKPISAENIHVFMDKIKARLDEESEHVRLKENYVLNQIKNRVIRMYLNGDTVNEDDQAMVSELGIDHNKKYVIVITEMVDYRDTLIQVEKKKNQCFLIIEELISNVFRSHHMVNGDYIFSIIEQEGQDFNKGLDIVLYKVVNYVQKYLSVNLAIGVSSQDLFKNASNLYHQCLTALTEYDITDQSAINYYNELKVTTKLVTLTVEEINEFRKNLRTMAEKDFLIFTRNLAEKIKHNHDYDYFNVVVSISGLLLEYANSIESDANVNLDVNSLKRYVDSKNIDGFMALIVKLTTKLKAEVISRKSKKSLQIMQSIMDFIEQNFHDPEMNMDRVCEEFYISVSYLSALFKKETETTFSRYLVAKRIEHAKFLLKNTGDKMVTIAEKCGYKDVYYFSHSFKKVTGQTPKRFRKDENS